MAKTLQPLPKRIALGGITYQINLVDKITSGAHVLNGRVYSGRPVIEIDRNMALEMQWQTLWHELVHVFLDSMGITEHDERNVGALANQITATLLTNGDKLLPAK